jgi:hypothetical protein
MAPLLINSLNGGNRYWVIILKGVRMKYVSKLVLLAMAVALIGRAAEAQGNGRFDGVDCVRAGDDGRGQACADVSCEDSNQQWPGLNDCEGSQNQIRGRNKKAGADPAAMEGEYLYDAQDVQSMIEAATDGMYTQEQAAVIDQEAFDAGVERGRVEMGREVDQAASEQPPVQWLDEVSRYCRNSSRCQEAAEYFPLIAQWPLGVRDDSGGGPLARWVGHDEDRAAALVLWTRASRAACRASYMETPWSGVDSSHWSFQLPESGREWGCCGSECD